jgi:alpha-galactosidase
MGGRSAQMLVDTLKAEGILIDLDDNCYSDEATGYPDTQYAPSSSPSSHYATMSHALAATGRNIVFQICDWGVDFPSAWAPKLGNSWRIANDIYLAYSSVSRILNQAAPQTNFAGPGQWLDLDMLEVGNGVYTIPEEQTHFSLWAIIKSPLIIGAALNDSNTEINADSLAILNNPSVISYNQDSLGVAAGFIRRSTEEGYELWGGPLSGNRYVAAVINLFDTPQELTLNLPDIGFQTAGTLNDIWNGVMTNNVLTSYTARVQPHGVLLIELSDTSPTNYYDLRFTSASK